MSSFRQRVKLLLKVALTLGLLILLFWRTDLGVVAATLRELTVGRWLLNFLLFLAGCMIAAAKWRALLPDQKFAALLRLNFIAQYYSILLPGQVVGEAIKTYRLGKGRVDAERIAASVIIDRITGFLGLLLIAAWGISLSDAAMKKEILLTLSGAFLLLILCLFSSHLSAWARLWNAVEKVGPRCARFAGQFRRLFDAWQAYVETPGLMLISILMGALYQLVAIWINFRIGHALGIQISFFDWCWVFGIVSIVVTFPFTVAGIGLREGSFIGALSLLGASPERALAHSFAVFSLILAGAAIGGMIEWARIRISSQGPGTSLLGPVDSNKMTPK